MAKEIVLPAIKEDLDDFDSLEEEILELFKKHIYLPLAKELRLPRTKLENSTDDLLNAIKSGTIYYHRGEFKGRFNSTISRELVKIGAKWDRRHGSFKIPAGFLSPSIRMAISLSEDKYQRTIDGLNKRIGKIFPSEVANKLKAEKIFDTTLLKLDHKFKKTLKGITVAPELTDEQRARIADEYTQNLKKYIVDWTEKETVELRETVQKAALKGERYETLIDLIKKRYRVSESKAKFLARQETSLMMTKFKETRYAKAGVHEYIWGCVAGSANHPVRPMHKRLEGKRFRWDQPPVVDDKGNRKNPGEDYNCRCFARPVVRF